MANTKLINDYGLRFYVRGMYVTEAAIRGGSQFRPFYKKDLKPFQLRVKCAVNRSLEVINSSKYKFSHN